jgi:hypothetical protein
MDIIETLICRAYKLRNSEIAFNFNTEEEYDEPLYDRVTAIISWWQKYSSVKECINLREIVYIQDSSQYIVR